MATNWPEVGLGIAAVVLGLATPGVPDGEAVGAYLILHGFKVF